ncbi:MAG: hypothetical protein ACKVX9_09100 [Blastocatellia bacterium]
MQVTGKIIEQTIQRASLIGSVIEDLVYEKVGPTQYRVELDGWEKNPQYKPDGFFVFSNLRKGDYKLKIAGERLQTMSFDARIGNIGEVTPSLVFLDSRGDNELIVIVRSVDVGANGSKKISFDPVVLLQPIRAGAEVFSPAGTAKLVAALEAGTVASARIDNANGLEPGSIVRIIRENSIRLKYDPYYVFASPITQIVGKVVSRQNPAAPLLNARVHITKINDVTVAPNDVGGVGVFTGADVSGNAVVLGVERDISTLTNEEGDYTLYFSNETLASLKITDQTLASLEAEGVPEDARTKLGSLKDLNFRGLGRFLVALRETIKEEGIRRYQPLIVKHAENFIRNLTLEASLEGHESASGTDSVESGRRNVIDFDLARS